jgi:formylglycine-generating enzyme required for sulfatase activity
MNFFKTLLGLSSRSPRSEVPRSRVSERDDGRVKVEAIIIHGAPDGWFRPGAGKVEWFKDHEHGPEMVVVPAGSFMMGSPESEPERQNTEGPQRRVTIAQPFAVSRHAITRGQFAAFVQATRHRADGAYRWTGESGDLQMALDPRASWRNPIFENFRIDQEDSHPVVNVNWNDAKAYTSWLTKLTGRGYRLLTEAEWEYSARAGTTTPFWWGSSITPAQANYDGKRVYAGGGSEGAYRGATVSGGSFAANPWGLYDVHGNVWEWCAWHDNYNGAPLDGSAWLQGGDASRRVGRGGSWNYSPMTLRSAHRGWTSPDRRYNGNGCRVGRTLAP